MSSTPEQDAIVAWLGRKAGISKAQAAELPSDLLSLLGSNHREGLTQLFSQLNRRVPEAKMRQQEKELAFVMAAIRDKAEQRMRAVGSSKVSQESEAEKEQRLEELIGNIETSFEGFERRIRECASQMTLPSYLDQQDFYGPFETMHINKGNDQRNMLTRYRKIHSGEESATIALQNPYYFFYNLLEEKNAGEIGNKNAAAAFITNQRMMKVSSDYDPESVVDALIQYHELRHANQDAVKRISLMQDPQGLQEYENFSRGTAGERPKVLVTEEATAYGYEMEALNVLLKGKLQSGRVPSVNEAMRDLGCKPEERSNIELLLSIAEHYFPEGMRDAGFSEHFLNFMRDTHIDLGYDVYVQWSTGGVRQMQRGPRTIKPK